MSAPRLAGLDALARGLSNLRANRELVVAHFLGSFATAAVALASLLPFFSILGVSLRSLLVDQLRNPFQPVFDPTKIDLGRLVSSEAMRALLVFGVGLTVAFAVWSWFQAGIFGVLVTGERQAPPGPGRASALFRTMHPREFLGRANRYAWRFFVYMNLFGTFFLLVVAFVVLLLSGAILTGTRHGVAAGIGVGCGGALPLFFLFLCLAGAYTLGLADLARDESGVLRATRAGFRILGRRLGAVVLLYLLFFVGVMTLTLLAGGASLFLTVGFAAKPAAFISLRLLLTILQSLASSIVSVATAGAMVALVRHESLEPRAS